MGDTYASDAFISNIIDGIGKRISSELSNEIMKYVENLK